MFAGIAFRYLSVLTITASKMISTIEICIYYEKEMQ